MFDLTSRIHDWRESLAEREAFREADLDELESHLRDSVTRLVSFRLSEEEAFLVALHRLGRPEALTTEFRKANGGSVWGRRLFWMLMGYLAVPLLLAVGSLLANVSVALGVRQGIEGAQLAYLSGFVLLLSIAVWVAFAATLTRASSSRVRESLDRSLAWLAGRRYIALAAIVSLVWAAKEITIAASSYLLRSLPPQTVHAVASPVQLLARLLAVAMFVGLILHTRRRLQASAATE